jgi:glycosyltransferase involved in cell wall biosynthesis
MREGIEVYHPRYLMTPKFGMSFYAFMMFVSVLRTVKEVQRNFDFDLIDAHWVYPDGLAAVLLGRLLRKPVVVSARGSDINLYSQFPVIRRLIHYALVRSNGVVAVSTALKQAMVGLGIPAAKISVIPNGVDLEKFHPLPKTEARKKLCLPMNSKVILSVGHLTANKGFHLVIKAIKILLQNRQQRNIALVIVGDGEIRKELEELVSALGLKQRVIFRGHVPHEELFLFYSAADLFCLASEMEGCPNVVLESLACGTPVVATFAGGIPEIVRSDNIGLLAEREESKFAQAIHIGLTKSWSSADLVEYAKEHSWPGAASAVHKVFASIIKGVQGGIVGNPHCGEDAPYNTR